MAESTDTVKPTRRVLIGLLMMVAASLASHFLSQLAVAQALPVRAPERVSEEIFVQIGGIEQWITINGDDRNNPVVLFLHGGPGNVSSPLADAMFAGWGKDFTVVQWDQRGAGRTYSKTGPSIEPTMTMDRMIQDGIEVAEYLRDHLHKKKLVLTGGSWGSVLGVHMVKTRPDLFYAYVGVAQIVSPDDWAAGYGRTLKLARQARDRNAITELEAIGPPPWDHIRKLGTWSRWTRVFESRAAGPAIELKPADEYASEAERRQANEAADFSQVHFFGLDMRGPLATLNLPALGNEFQVPVFILQGEADLKAFPEVTRAYFNRIRAPMKKYYLVRRSGHEPSAAMMQQWLKVLIEQVRPLTRD